MSETTKIVGRNDYGWGVEMATVAIEGYEFLTYGGKVYEPCGMCDEGGTSGSKRHFAHVLAAVCFDCNGKGWSKVYDSAEAVAKVLRRREADRARRERKAAAKAAEQAAAADAWAAANPEVAERLAAIRAESNGDFHPQSDEAIDAAYAVMKTYGDFIVNIASRAYTHGLTEKQTTAVAEALAEHDQKVATEAAKRSTQRYYGAKGEKVTATGTVVVATSIEGQYGMSRLLVIEGTGDFAGVTFKTFGNGATLRETAKDDEVEFTATIKAHEDYNSTPQTVITRAKIKTLASA